MRGKYFGLLVMLLFGFAVLLAPTAAKALDPTITLQATATDDFSNTWTIQSRTYDVCVDYNLDPVTDNKGNSISGRTFQYEISITDSHGDPIDPPPNVIQYNVDFPLSENGTWQWYITSPDDRSSKAGFYDVNTQWRYDDTTKGVISVKSIKLLPSNHYLVSLCIANGGVNNQAQALVESEVGNITFGDPATGFVLGPINCSETQSTSSMTVPAPSGLEFGGVGWEGATGDILLTYDQCTGDFLGVKDAGNLKPYDRFTKFYVGYGTYTSYYSKTMDLALRVGPENAFAAFGNRVVVGYGTQFFLGPYATPNPTPYPKVAPYCSGTPDYFIAVEDSFYAWYKDGNLCDVTNESPPLPTSTDDYDSDNSALVEDAWGWMCWDKVSTPSCTVIYDSPWSVVDGSRYGYGSTNYYVGY